MTALATRAEVKAALNITDTDSDDQIDALLAPMSALVELEAGRKFTPQEFTERHRGGDASIVLRNYPVGVDASPGITVTDKITGEVLASTDYEIDHDRGILRKLPLGTEWPKTGSGNLVYLGEDVHVDRWEISYTAGEVPDDIKLALYLSIGASLDRSGSTSSGGGGAIGGIIAEKDGDYSYQRAASAATTSNSASLAASSLPASAAAIARQYRAGVFV